MAAPVTVEGGRDQSREAVNPYRRVTEYTAVVYNKIRGFKQTLSVGVT